MKKLLEDFTIKELTSMVEDELCTEVKIRGISIDPSGACLRVDEKYDRVDDVQSVMIEYEVTGKPGNESCAISCFEWYVDQQKLHFQEELYDCDYADFEHKHFFSWDKWIDDQLKYTSEPLS